MSRGGGNWRRRSGVARRSNTAAQRRSGSTASAAGETCEEPSPFEAPSSHFHPTLTLTPPSFYRSGTYFCIDKSVTAVVIQGLAEHKESLGAPLCPCRHYDDKAAEAANGFWNCPCVPMRERKECHCMLFLTEDNDFAGKEQHITHDEIMSGINTMM